MPKGSNLQFSLLINLLIISRKSLINSLVNTIAENSENVLT